MSSSKLYHTRRNRFQFQPDDVDNLKIWLDATYQVLSSTGPDVEATDGDTVVKWRNKKEDVGADPSAYGSNITFKTNPSRLEMGVNILGGIRYEFGVSNNPLTGEASVTLYIVFKCSKETFLMFRGFTNAAYAGVNSQSNQGTDADIGHNLDTAGTDEDYYITDAVVFDSFVGSENSGETRKDLWEAYADGQICIMAIKNADMADTFYWDTIDFFSYTTPYNFVGTVYEILGYAKDVSDEENNKILKYLKEKWIEPATRPNKTDLLAWWSMDESSGDRLDSHINAYNLSENGAPAQVVGQVSSGVALTGASNYLNNDAMTNVSNRNFTSMGWMNLQSVGASDWHCFGQYGTTTATQCWLMYHNPSTDKMRFLVSDENGVAYYAESNGTFNDSSGWFHVAGVRQGDNLSLYINGEKQTTEDTFVGQENLDVQPFWVNRESSDYGDAYYDEIVIYTEALTDDQISWHYNGGNGRSYSELG